MFKNSGHRGGSSEPPESPPDPPLVFSHRFHILNISREGNSINL